MLTPGFELAQDRCWLYIEIRAPFTKVSECEIFVDGKEFKFYSKPYYLRLNLPGEVTEDGRESAKYDADSGSFSIKFPKAKPGEVFQGLDMLTKLLAPSGGNSAQQPLIEVLDKESSPNSENNHSNENEEAGGQDDDEEEDFDWQIDQEPYTEDLDAVKLDLPRYGFANLRSGVFKRLQSELHDIVDLPEADTTPACERRKLRLEHEQTQFDEDYYLSDLYQNDAISTLLHYEPPWVEEYKQHKGGAKAEDIVIFTEDEKQQMRNLPRKEYLLDAAETRKALLGLVDLVFAYCYNHRTTEGENTVESGWTVAKLSATLSWLETYSSLRDALVTSYRRCLCYPLYRHWKLTQKVHKDVLKIFCLGRRRLLKCLLEIHNHLRQSDPRYILNDLYITDYCVWIQGVGFKHLCSLYQDMEKIKIAKKNLYIDLDLLEQAAELALSENREAGTVADQIANLHISKNALSDVQTDGEVQLADQIKELSIQKGKSQVASSAEGICHVPVKPTILPSGHRSSDHDSDSSEESDSSEYTTASEYTDSDDSSGSEELHSDPTDLEPVNATAHSESVGAVGKPLIVEIDSSQEMNSNSSPGNLSLSEKDKAQDASSLNF